MAETTLKSEQIISYLSFGLGKEYFALNVSKVINILEMQKITKVPKSPDFIRGIINLRGEVLPVIDTNTKLGMGETQTTNSTCILVIETIMFESLVKFGILVDSVHEVLEIEDDDILPSPTIGKQYEVELLNGVVEQEDSFVMILDINKLLDFKDLSHLQNTTKKAGKKDKKN